MSKIGESLINKNFKWVKVETNGNYVTELMVEKQEKAVLNIIFPRYKNKRLFIQVYVPTEQHDESAEDFSYNQLSSVLEATRKNVMVE